jgi:F-type H+-transporting ATPase subunit delta
MPKDNHQSPLAVAYAQALLDLANETKNAEAIGEELGELRQIIDANEQFAQVLADPAISNEERGQLLHRVFDGRASQLVLKFLGLVNEKNRLSLLPAIAGAYDDLLDQQRGNIEVDVTVAHPLNDDQMESVRRTVSEALKKNAVVHQFLDESIIGGIVLRVKDQLIDDSVRAQLTAMRHKLLSGRPI